MKIVYEVGLDDILAFQLHHERTRPTASWIAPVLFAPLLVTAAVLGWWGTVGLATGVAASWTAILSLYSGPSASAVHRNHAAGLYQGVVGRHELELAEGRLVERHECGEQTTKLERLHGIERTETHAFIRTSPLAAHVVPRAAVSEGDFDLFLEALSEAVVAAKPSPPAFPGCGGRAPLVLRADRRGAASGLALSVVLLAACAWGFWQGWSTGRFTEDSMGLVPVVCLTCAAGYLVLKLAGHALRLARRQLTDLGFSRLLRTTGGTALRRICHAEVARRPPG
ncbi:MAG: hypothetical protein K2W96_23660, partial [Gemmataceae bacterium]|nr:hypothetical protein [Gemmataceae bacterium]